MPNYYVEGLYLSRQAAKKARRTGKITPGSIEPYAKTIWANNPQEALQIATAGLEGGEWTEGPRVSLKTEELRMRSEGAPELPGLFARKPKNQKKKSKSRSS